MSHPHRPAARRLALRAVLFATIGLAIPSHAHNGSLAVGGPLRDIVVDADFSDWPEELPSWPINVFGGSRRPIDAIDLSGSLRVGL